MLIFDLELLNSLFLRHYMVYWMTKTSFSFKDYDLLRVHKVYIFYINLLQGLYFS